MKRKASFEEIHLLIRKLEIKACLQQGPVPWAVEVNEGPGHYLRKYGMKKITSLILWTVTPSGKCSFNVNNN